jgi:hypothetical protein
MTRRRSRFDLALLIGYGLCGVASPQRGWGWLDLIVAVVMTGYMFECYIKGRG